MYDSIKKCRLMDMEKIMSKYTAEMEMVIAGHLASIIGSECVGVEHDIKNEYVDFTFDKTVVRIWADFILDATPYDEKVTITDRIDMVVTDCGVKLDQPGSFWFKSSKNGLGYSVSSTTLNGMQG